MINIFKNTIRKFLWHEKDFIRITAWYLFPRLRRFLYLNKEIITTYDDDIVISCYLKHFLDNQLFWQGMQEGDVAIYLYLKKHLDKNTILIDIGAGIGTFTLIGCKYSKHVIAFEPCPIHYEKLIKNINLNNFKNVDIYKIGLSSESGIAKLYVPKLDNLGMSSLKPHLSKNLYNEVQIKVDILDNYIDIVRQYAKKQDKIIIKMDVEGHELQVLKGAKNFIEGFKPVIISEFELRYFDDNDKRNILTFCEEYGYRAFMLENYKYKDYKIREFIIDKFSNTHQNIILLPK